jgi:predicted DNA-binding transcriptional regulator AlpA
MSDVLDAGEARARRMLDEKQVLLILRVGHATIWRMVKSGQFPKPTFVSPNRCFWFEDVILAWQNEIEGQRRGSAKLKLKDVEVDDQDGPKA